MSTVLRRSCLKAGNNVLCSGSVSSAPTSLCLVKHVTRSFSEFKTPEFSNSTILMENGLNVQELPVIVRKLKDISEMERRPVVHQIPHVHNPLSYLLIQAEFSQCVDLRDVFALLSKCTRISSNIAVGAIERIYELEKNPSALTVDANMHANLAKGAILDKLLKVIMTSEDTQTILNVLQTVSTSTFMEPYKHAFTDELLFRVIDNMLTVEQLCEFVTFLINNKSDPKYSETIDKLWVGFVEQEREINENNIVEIFKILPGLKVSKRTIFCLLEQKLADLWSKIKVPVMQEILHSYVEEKYSSLQTFSVVGRWLYTNIHALDEDSLLDMITKLTRLNYSDDQIEKAVEKYMKLKGSKINSHVLIVGILNYCMNFQICNDQVLNICSEYFLRKSSEIPSSFLKCFIYPYGFLCFDPVKSEEFWARAEKELNKKFDKITADDISSIIMAFIYVGRHPLELVNKLLSPEYLVKVNNPLTMKKLHLIDTALSLESEMYPGPLLPKDRWSNPITQDARIKNIVEKIKDRLMIVAGGAEKLSTAVQIPYLYSDETYLIDVMVHPAGLGSNTFNWKLKSAKNENIAILIHLPDHYCSNNERLIGSQVMRKKHLKLLGMKVVSLKYSLISQFYTSYNSSGLTNYLNDCIENAEQCIGE